MTIDYHLIVQAENRATGAVIHDLKGLLGYYTLYIGLIEKGHTKFTPLVEYFEVVIRRFIKTGKFPKDWATCEERPKISARDFVHKGDTCLLTSGNS